MGAPSLFPSPPQKPSQGTTRPAPGLGKKEGDGDPCRTWSPEGGGGLTPSLSGDLCKTRPYPSFPRTRESTPPVGAPLVGARSPRNEDTQRSPLGEGIPKPLSLWERLREGTRPQARRGRVAGGWSRPAPAGDLHKNSPIPVIPAPTGIYPLPVGAAPPCGRPLPRQRGSKVTVGEGHPQTSLPLGETERGHAAQARRGRVAGDGLAPLPLETSTKTRPYPSFRRPRESIPSPVGAALVAARSPGNEDQR